MVSAAVEQVVVAIIDTQITSSEWFNGWLQTIILTRFSMMMMMMMSDGLVIIY